MFVSMILGKAVADNPIYFSESAAMWRISVARAHVAVRSENSKLLGPSEPEFQQSLKIDSQAQAFVTMSILFFLHMAKKQFRRARVIKNLPKCLGSL